MTEHDSRETTLISPRRSAAQETCPSCGAQGMSVFYEFNQAPVHSVLLLNSRQEAVNFPKGSIALGFCPQCGFISNTAFDPAVQDYSTQYESTQGYSPTFNSFHRRLAVDLIERYDLHGKEIIEIGCGQGDFLALLCELGGNRGVGFDPAFVPERSLADIPNGVTFVRDFYSEKYAGQTGDFICCKMTLEHIHPTGEFVRMVRRAVEGRSDAVVFFQVPNARYVFGETAFWDIYYEHCSYFSLGSMARLFRQAGFEILDLWTDYADQYLMITVKVQGDPPGPHLAQENDLAEMSALVARFQQVYPQKTAAWRRKINALSDQGRRIVLWGGGSKSVAFLTTLGIPVEQIESVVDINPHKSGTYIAGTGQQIISPGDLPGCRPDTVIVMNPVYRREVEQAVHRVGLAAEILTVQSV